MSAKGSVYPRHLLGIQPDGHESEWGVVDGSAFIPFCVTIDTASGVTTQYVFNGTCPGHARVWMFVGTMLANGGGGGGTIKLQRVRQGTAADITDTVSTNASADHAVIANGYLDEEVSDLQPGDSLTVVTANNPQVRLNIFLAWRT